MNGTGLAEPELRKLSAEQRLELGTWTIAKCGGKWPRLFLPNAVRWLPLEQRLALATDLKLDVAWEELERRKVATGGEHPLTGDWTPGWAYFTEAYGHLRPPTGPAIPFDLWPEQRIVLEEIRQDLRQFWAKARQLGMTWLALHDAFHLLAFDPFNLYARVLALSRTGGDASKLLMRGRAIQEQLPAFLRPEEASDTRRSMTRFGILGRGEMVSLMGTPDAARMETATLAILDEFAFYRNRGAGRTLTAVQPTLGALGRLIVLSTGNGPADAPGDGQAFAEQTERGRSRGVLRKVERAEIYESETADGKSRRLVFLPASTDPNRRSKAWRESERDSYMTEEEFEAEHPETIDHALQGQPRTKVYPPAGIAAALRLGGELRELRLAGKLPPPAAPHRAEIVAIDWGEQTVGLELWPLEQGGFYVVREVVHSHLEPESLVEPLLGGALSIPAAAAYDAAGVQSMRTFAATARRDARWAQLRTIKVPFGSYKDESVKYLRRLFRRTARLLEEREEELKARVRALNAGQDREPEPVALVQVLAIDPEDCPVLARQLKGLEFDDDDVGKVKKGDDHGPDALIAGVAKTARRFRAKQSGAAPEPDEDAEAG